MKKSVKVSCKKMLTIQVLLYKLLSLLVDWFIVSQIPTIKNIRKEKAMKKILSVILVCILSISMSTTIFAQSERRDLKYVKEEVEKLFIEQKIDGTIDIFNDIDTKAFLRYIRNKKTVIELEKMLSLEGYTLDESKNSVINIIDNKSYAGFIMGFEVYQNPKDDMVVVCYLYETENDALQLVFAQKIDTNSKVSEYFVKHDTTPTQWRAFNQASFLCGLGSTIACGAYSAMLMAIPPASVIGGLTCELAFAWVCAHE